MHAHISIICCWYLVFFPLLFLTFSVYIQVIWYLLRKGAAIGCVQLAEVWQKENWDDVFVNVCMCVCMRLCVRVCACVCACL